MKLSTKLIKWSVLALSIELIGFVYVDKFYLSETKSFNVSKVELKKAVVKKKVNVDMPMDAKNINISYDGKYAAYTLNGNAVIINREDGKSKNISITKGTTVEYLKWLPDRDRMYIVEKAQGYLLFYSYDALKDENVQWVDNHGIKPRITLPSSKYIVKDMALSTLTNVTYVEIASSTRSIVYRFNAMSQVAKLKDYNYKIGRIGVMQLEDKYICEDPYRNKFYVEGYTNFLKGKNITNPSFLGADYDDNLYIGSMEGSKVTKIYYGMLKDNFFSWNTVELPVPVTSSNIYISTAGNIYENDSSGNKVINAKNGKESSYKGKLVQIYKTGIVSMEGSELTENTLN